MTGAAHPDEIASSATLVARLVAAQFPGLAGLPVTALAPGTDHAIYRLGDALAVRLPRRPGAAAQAGKTWTWLPLLAPLLPVPVPEPVGLGVPTPAFPWPWLICRWIDGEVQDAVAGGSTQLARDLAGFIAALRRAPGGGGPGPGAHNFGRGAALVDRDADTMAAIAALASEIDGAVAAAVWRQCRDAHKNSVPAWLHGDLAAGNLLVRAGRLAAVIDFGGLAIGDPACDLMPAWSLFEGEARAVFRAAIGADTAEWARGRGWALSVAMIQLRYYRAREPALATAARRTIAAILADRQPI